MIENYCILDHQYLTPLQKLGLRYQNVNRSRWLINSVQRGHSVARSALIGLLYLVIAKAGDYPIYSIYPLVQMHCSQSQLSRSGHLESLSEDYTVQTEAARQEDFGNTLLASAGFPVPEVEDQFYFLISLYSLPINNRMKIATWQVSFLDDVSHKHTPAISECSAHMSCLGFRAGISSSPDDNLDMLFHCVYIISWCVRPHIYMEVFRKVT